jgi:hypothetical protein
MMRKFSCLILVLAVFMPAVSRADGQGQALMKKWVGSDRCSQQAYRAFPDYTPDSLAKRDLAFQQCLANGNLPPRDVPPPNKP